MLKFNAGEAVWLGIKVNTLSIPGNSLKAVCTLWTSATVYYLILWVLVFFFFLVGNVIKALKRVHR